MTAPIRHGALALLVGVTVIAAAAGLARAARAPAGVADARIVSSFVMHGRVTTAVRVRGERRGQRVTRAWTFTGLGCAGEMCPRLRVRRQRSAHRFDTLTLSRVGVGSYAGSGRFASALRCRGRRFAHALVVPYTVQVQVTQVVVIEGIPFAEAVRATYTNRRRIDHTRCPIGPSHDAARYTGTAAPVPSPPAATFSVAVSPGTDTATFTDTSTPGAGGAPVVGRVWDFNDPASGAANSATASPVAHTFSAPGTYEVSLTVIDANGLTGASAQTVTVPGLQPSKATVASTALSSPIS
ncbi:MAG TPA: PKD domain-containing protein [Solirubrobacteraceae bacterium]|nr:PKD domain-containing protein [Solirubrobacteraceae bacterium]